MGSEDGFREWGQSSSRSTSNAEIRDDLYLIVFSAHIDWSYRYWKHGRQCWLCLGSHLAPLESASAKRGAFDFLRAFDLAPYE